jgi:superfamily II DNA or RNA helicase
MANTQDLIKALDQALSTLLTRGTFETGKELRKTQRQALEAYHADIRSDALTDEDKIIGSFKIPTGVGKTAVFVALVSETMKNLKSQNIDAKTAIVVPMRKLLGQTYDSFNDFAPSSLDMIGFYGDGYKDIEKPITIITYNGWSELSKNGYLNSDVLDMLISDESHRITSDARIEVNANNYDHRTIQLAFTATDRFNQEEKSVEASHKRTIFRKPMAEAIMDDELASYIQSQRMIIRVEPSEFMLSDEFNDATKGLKTKERRLQRQKAWNKYVTQFYIHGKDERTGDPLTDNQAGFFVDGIDQANALEKLLNKNPELQKRAAAQGYKTVAYAIHSELSPDEQDRRFKAYKNGECMAIIGDEQFKEGFDQKEMKTLFDYPRNSIVDKEQIIGRGARKWWNPIKQRWEGMTIIDTVLYIGDKDKEQNELNRERAIRNSISVKDVLGENFVYAPSAPPKAPKDKEPQEDDNIIFEPYIEDDSDFPEKPQIKKNNDWLDDNVEIYVTEDEIFILDAQVARARKEHIIEITEEMVEELRSEVERTNVGSKKFYTLHQEIWPEDLSPSIIHSIFRNKTKIAEYHLNWIKQTYKTLETVEQMKKVDITPQIIEELKSEMQRTNVGSQKLYALHQEIWPEGLTPRILDYIFSKASKIISEPHLNWIKQTYKTLETVEQMKRVDITPQIIEELKSEMQRTNVGGPKFYTLHQEIWPKDLSPSIIACILRNTKTIAEPYLNWIKQTYKTLETVEQMKKVDITPQIIEELKNEMQRTNVGSQKLYALHQEIWPEGLTPRIIDSSIFGNTKTIAEPYLNWIKQTYKTLETVEQMKKVDITPQIIEELKSEIQRTNIGGQKLYALHQEIWPKGLTPRIIDGIFRNTKTIAEPYLDFLIQTYASLPDAKPKLKGELSTAFDATQTQNEIDETQAKETKPQLLQNRQP